MIRGFDQFYRRPLPNEYRQQSAANYEMSFEDQSILENLLSNDSIGTAQIQNLAITESKIKSLKWNKAQGGTATLGGENNTDGILSVKNSNNEEKGRWDKDGIIIEDGKLVVKNLNNATIMDSKGIVSLNNFISDSKSGTPDTSFTSSTYAIASGSSMNFNLKRASNILVLLSVQIAGEATTPGSDFSGRVIIAPHLDSVEKIPEILIDISYDATDLDGDNIKRKSYSTSMLLKQVTSGYKTLDFRYKINGGVNITAHLYNWSLAYVILGS